MPAVPRRDERPFHAPPSNRDFVRENAVAAMTAEPRGKGPRAAGAGAAATDWLAVPTFGKVPAYLDRIKAEREAEREYFVNLLDQQQMEAEAAAGGSARELTDDERTDLLDALTAKWDAVNTKYQVIAHRKISTSNSTAGEIRWKESCEAQMAALEADIKKLSVRAPIYVVE
jgi:hypothetical protein